MKKYLFLKHLAYLSIICEIFSLVFLKDILKYNSNIEMYMHDHTAITISVILEILTIFYMVFFFKLLFTEYKLASLFIFIIHIIQELFFSKDIIVISINSIIIIITIFFILNSILKKFYEVN